MTDSLPQLRRTNTSGQTLHGDDTIPLPKLPDLNAEEHDGVHTPPIPETLPVRTDIVRKHLHEEDGEVDSNQIITLPLSDPEHPNNWSKRK